MSSPERTGSPPVSGLPRWYRAAVYTAIIAGSFSLVILLLLTANLVRARAVDPLKPARIEALKADLIKQPANEAAKAELRQLDLELRTAYFQSRTFAIQGIFMLLIEVSFKADNLDACVLEHVQCMLMRCFETV